MKAVFYPVGDITRASSRYRVHWIVAERDNFFMGGRKNWKKADAAVFQRAISRRHVRIAQSAKAAGKLVIFDVSDFHFYRHRWKASGVGKMALLAHCITTANEDDAHEIRAVFKKRCHVVPNAQRESKHRRKHSNVDVPIIAWIGRENRMLKTLGAIWPALERLSRERVPFRVLIINDTGNTHGLSLPLNRVSGKRWELDEVYPTLAKCDVGVCPQVKQADGRYHKDMNKAVTCWMCGVPCVTFRTTKDWYGDLRKLLTNWQFREKQGYKGIVRAKAWTPGVVVKRWEQVMESELGKMR